MPVNVSPEYAQAEKKFLEAQNDEDKIFFLEELIRQAPAHKGGEALRANLRTRYKKFKENLERKKKTTGASNRETIKKDDMQFCIIGFPNSGKSSLFQALTQQKTNITNYAFSTTTPKLATTNYQDVKIQTIDMPPFPNEDKSLVNSADTLLIIVRKLEEINESEKFLYRTKAKKIIVFNKEENTDERKISENLKSKYKNYKYKIINCSKPEKTILEELKKEIFETFPIVRVYTKEPKKEASKTPMILKKDSKLGDVAEKILKGMSKKIKRAKIWGPSSKFPGQTVGLTHIIKDKDIVEFQTE